MFSLVRSCTADFDGKLAVIEQSSSAFKMFLVALYFMWKYPRNARDMTKRFNICKTYAKGEPLWKWIRKIQALKAVKIKWEVAEESFCLSVDCKDFTTNEYTHPTFTIDEKWCSHKTHQCTTKYEVGLHPYEPKVMWLNGPFHGGLHDMTIFQLHGLKKKIPKGKLVIANRGYASNFKGEKEILCTTNFSDPEPLMNFKSRQRLCHKSFFGLMVDFSIISKTFCHNVAEKHLWQLRQLQFFASTEWSMGLCSLMHEIFL